MNRYPDDDEWYKFKLGRFDDSEERRMERTFTRYRHLCPRRSPYKNKRVFPLVRSAPANRAHTIVNGWNNEGFPEAVIKFASQPKSKMGVQACAHYVARFDNAKDEFGYNLDREAIKERLEDWDLLPDAENLSKKARTLNAEGEKEEARILPEKKRLYHIQARHLVFSIKSGDDPEKEAKDLEQAMFATVDTFFATDGHRVIWAVHQDHSEHIHAHVIVKAKPRHGTRLWIDSTGDFHHALRTDFAMNLCMVGLSHQATRREDRYQLRSDIMMGKEPLRNNYRQAELHQARREQEERELSGIPYPPQNPPRPFLSGAFLGFITRKKKKLRKEETNPALQKVMEDREQLLRQLNRIADLDEALTKNETRPARIREIAEALSKTPIVQTPPARKLPMPEKEAPALLIEQGHSEEKANFGNYREHQRHHITSPPPNIPVEYSKRKRRGVER